ncbi:MAG TPA: AGE family epimerase/isomerase, partial [Longimicrobiales bacterium]
MSDELRQLGRELRQELTEGILPYWLERAVDQRHGGFVGYITGDEVVRDDDPKGSILNARILWTFSAAYRALGVEKYRAAADRAADYIHAHFVDPEHRGVYWMVDARGAPLDARKHIYAQAFALYGLSEHARATRCARSLESAIELYHLIERHAADRV